MQVQSQVLSVEEHRAKHVHPEFLKRIRSFQSPRVLDWGSGRGSDVVHLREQGIEAYGAEIDQATLDRGKPLFDKLGLDHAAILKKISDDNRTDFPDGYFDVIMSYYVLEHVQDLSSAVREMRRLLRPGGISIHLFPAWRSPLEDHLRMPMIHWLPKNRLRLAAIYACTAAGFGPRHPWPKCEGKSLKGRAEIYYQFTCRQTYYRPPGAIRAEFRKAGFEPSFEAHKHERICKTPLRSAPAKPLEWLLSTFVGSVLVARAC